MSDDQPLQPITPAGFAAMRARYEELFQERPKLVEVISWAAGNGDRSENGDYIYGRKRLREIDRELTFLSRRMKILKIVDPTTQEDRSRAWFGAIVTVADDTGARRIVTLVGEDEADATGGTNQLALAVRAGTAGGGDRRRAVCGASGRHPEL